MNVGSEKVGGTSRRGGSRLGVATWGGLLRFAVVAGLSQAVAGCIFIEGNAGYYAASWSAKPASNNSAPLLTPSGASGGVGFGFKVGTYFDYPLDNERVRVALEVDNERFNGSTDQGSFSAVPAGIGLRGDVTVYQIRDYERVRATFEWTPLSGGRLHTPVGRDMRIKSTQGFYFAGTYQRGDRDQSLAGSLGLRTTTITNAQSEDSAAPGQTNGLTFIGPEARISYSVNVLSLFSDSADKRRQAVTTTDVVFEKELSTYVDLLEPFVDAAKKLGCSVYRPSQRVVARCPGIGNVGLRQIGRKVQYLCTRGASEADCKERIGKIIKREREELAEGELLEIRWSKDVESEIDVLTPFLAGAQKIGCSPKRADSRASARCSDGFVGLQQTGKKIEYLCAPGLATDACKAVLKKIVDAAKEGSQ